MIAEIEDVLELLTRLDLAGDLQLGVIEPHQLRAERVVGIADPPSVGELELVQVARSHRANAASMASANCSNECDGPTRKTRPGDGSHPTPRPPSKSTRIRSHVRATARRAYGVMRQLLTARKAPKLLRR